MERKANGALAEIESGWLRIGTTFNQTVECWFAIAVMIARANGAGYLPYLSMMS